MALESGAGGGQGRDRPAVHHRGAHHHRLAGADQAEHRQGARLRARRGRDPQDQGAPRLQPRRALRRDRRGARARPRGGRPRPGRARRVAAELRRLGRGQPRAQAAVRPDGRRAGCPTAGPTRCPPSTPRRTASRTRSPPGPRPARCSTALAPVLPELWGGSADLAESNNTTMEGEPSFVPGRPADQGMARRPVRPDAALRHPRARDGFDHERHHAARRHPRLRRHLPGVQRLHAPAGPAGRADEAAHHLRLDARLDRPRRGRPDPPADRAAGRAARHPRPGRGPAGRRQRDRGRLAQVLENTDRPAGLALSRQTLPVLDAGQGGRRRQGRLRAGGVLRRPSRR